MSLRAKGGPALHFEVFSYYRMFLTYRPCRASGRLFTTETQIQKQAKYGIYGVHYVIGQVSVRVMLCPWRSWIRTSWYNYENTQQDALYRLIYYSKSALHVSGDVFAHQQEHLTVFTVSGSVHPSCCRFGWVGTAFHLIQDTSRKYRPKHVELTWHNKLTYRVSSCWLFSQ
jgi:hypothetical protein